MKYLSSFIYVLFLGFASWGAVLFAQEAARVDIASYDALKDMQKDQFDTFKGLKEKSPDAYQAFEDYRNDQNKTDEKLEALLKGEPDLALIGKETVGALGVLPENQLGLLRVRNYDAVMSTIPEWRADAVEKRVSGILGDREKDIRAALSAALKSDAKLSDLDEDQLKKLKTIVENNPNADIAKTVIELAAKSVKDKGETTRPITAQDYITSFVEALASLKEVSSTTIEPLLPKPDAAEMRITVIGALVDDLKPGGQILSGAPKTQGMVRSELARQLAATDLSKITNIDDRITALTDMNNLAKDFSRDITTGEKVSERQIVRDAALMKLIETIGDYDVMPLEAPLQELSSQLKKLIAIDQGRTSKVLSAVAKRLENRIKGGSDLAEAKGFGVVLEDWQKVFGGKSDAYTMVRDAMRDRLLDLFKLDSDIKAEDIKGIDLATSTFQSMLSVYFSDSKAVINSALGRRLAQLPLDPYLKVVRTAFEKIAATKTDAKPDWSDTDEAQFVKELAAQLPKDTPMLRVEALMQFAEQLLREAPRSAPLKITKGAAEALPLLAQEIAKTDLSKIAKIDDRIAILKNMSYAIAAPYETGSGKTYIEAALQKNLIETSELMKKQGIAAADRLEKWKEAALGPDGLTNMVAELRKQVKEGSAIAEDLVALDESSKPEDRALALVTDTTVQLDPKMKGILKAQVKSKGAEASPERRVQRAETIAESKDILEFSAEKELVADMTDRTQVIEAAKALASAKLTLWEKTKLKAVDAWNAVVDAFSRVTVGLRLKTMGYTYYNRNSIGGESSVGRDAAIIIKAKSLGERTTFLTQVKNSLAKVDIEDAKWKTLQNDFQAKQKAAQERAEEFQRDFNLNPADRDFYDQVAKRIKKMIDLDDLIAAGKFKFENRDYDRDYEGLTKEQISRAFEDEASLIFDLEDLVEYRQAVIDAGGNVLAAVADDVLKQAVDAVSQESR